MAKISDQSRRKISIWVGGLAAIAVSILSAKLIYIVGMMVILRNIGHGDEGMVPFAQSRLHSSNVFIRDAAARGLGSIGPKAAPSVPDLITVLRTDDSQAATSAAAALGYIHSPQRSGNRLNNLEVVAALIDALSNQDGEIRRYAAYGISIIGPAAESAIPKLTQQIESDPVAYTAARALGEMGPAAQSAIPALTSLLASSHAGARAEAALALSRLAPLPAETVEAIKRCLTDEDELVRNAARKAIGALGQ